jgi:cellulose biosynthesis protein BcsQ
MFAQILLAIPWYEDFAFWAVFLGALGGAATITWLLARIYYRRRVDRANDERDRLNRDLRDAKDALKKAKSGGEKRSDLERKLADSQQDNEQLQEDLADSQETAQRLQKVFDRLNRNLRIGQQMAGLTWRVPQGDAAPPFVPLDERRVPVIAVLNLKGGVGKTTLTANLAAAYARIGWRILLVDLDLQASLTSLFIPGEQLQQAAENQRLIQHYFEQAAAGQAPSVIDFMRPCSEPRVELVGSADTLAYAELNLTVRWLLQPGKNDPRMLLRTALHGENVRQFNLILIDCPPLLNISCVNALAAADFLLVPIVPSKSATDRVRPMIGWLRALRHNLNPDLKIIGVVANRLSRATGMSAEELNLWTALRDQCHDAWGEPVPMCEVFIPQSIEIRNAENERRPLKIKDSTFEFIQKLAAELAERLPHSSRPTKRSSGITGAKK